MTETMQKAINKIDQEAEKLGAHGKTIAQYIIDELITSDYKATMILDGSKTLSGCISDVTSKAKSRAKDGMAMIEEKQVWQWVKTYYGFGFWENEAPETATKKAAGISVDLADFLT